MTPETQTFSTEIIGAAGRIMDVFMGGDTSWRTRADLSDIYESADWARAVDLAAAALSSEALPVGSERSDEGNPATAEPKSEPDQ